MGQRNILFVNLTSCFLEKLVVCSVQKHAFLMEHLIFQSRTLLSVSTFHFRTLATQKMPFLLLNIISNYLACYFQTSYMYTYHGIEKGKILCASHNAPSCQQHEAGFCNSLFFPEIFFYLPVPSIFIFYVIYLCQLLLQIYQF